MNDLKRLLKKLPPEKPEKIADNVVRQIIQREIARFREKRYSRLILGILLVLVVLGILKLFESASILGTSEFWQLVKEDRAFLDFQSFCEGNPLIEGIFVVIISLLVLVPIWIIRHKDKIIGR